MNVNDIINILRQMDNQSLQSSILPWQMQDISKAQLLSANTNPSAAELLKYARGLSSVCKEGDIDKTEYFCFLPVSSKRWKVFALDRFNRVLAQLEDFEGKISVGEASYIDSFLLKI